MSDKFTSEAKLAQESGFTVRTVEGGYLLAGDSIALDRYTDAQLSASQAREAELQKKLEGLTGEACELISKLKEAKSKAVPEGWQLVPKDPTEKMLAAGYFTEHAANRGMWRSMLAVAPQPENKE